jgi:hypothetical protein
LCTSTPNTRANYPAGSSGDRGGAALGDRLLGGAGTPQDGADLGEDLGEVDLADATSRRVGAMP